jgi:predicted membrane metal-binding protein
VKTYDNSILVEEEGNNYFVTHGNDEDFFVGDEVHYSCDYTFVDAKTDSFAFYLKAQNTEYTCYTDDVYLDNHNESYRNSLLGTLRDSDTLYANFSLMMFFGEVNASNQQIDDMVNNLGINHLFVISGFHIALFMTMIEKFLKLFIKNDSLRFIISSILSLGFIYLIFMP